MEYVSDQEKEMKLALRDNRQPNCVYCDHPLDSVKQLQNEDITWTWNKLLKRYDKSDDGGAERPYHYCGECRDNCEASDWNYVDERLIDY